MRNTVIAFAIPSGAPLQKVDLLVRGCSVIPMDGSGVIEKGVVAISGGLIAFVGKQASTRDISAETVLEGRRRPCQASMTVIHMLLRLFAAGWRRM